MNPRCIVSERFRFVCVLIAKNASSTLEAQLLLPQYKSRRVRASELRPEERETFTTFAMLRDPVSRLLSGYQEVSLRHEMGETASGLAPFFEMDDTEARFEAFLTALEQGYVDAHLRPQIAFLGSLRIDQYASVECLDADMGEILGALNAGACPPLPRRRSRDGRSQDHGYSRFNIREGTLSQESIDRIRSLYSGDFAAYQAQIVRPYAHSGRLLALYRQANENLPSGVVYRLGTRGFYAELTTVARAMLYALGTKRQFLLDSRSFSYRETHGWRDYFEPFCTEVEGDASADDAYSEWEICDSEIRGEGTRFDAVRGFRIERIRIGEVPIDGFMNILGALFTAIYRYRPEISREINQRIADLRLGDAHATIHIRRGDKIDDEDIHYPAGLYVERLSRFDRTGLAIFAMSDEHAAVEELSRCLAERNDTRAVVSMTEPADKGFDVFALRREDLHEVGAAEREGPDVDFRTFISREARRLLTDVEIARRSEFFVGTFYSNIGKSVRFLHKRPERCLLLEPGDVDSFVAARRSDGDPADRGASS